MKIKFRQTGGIAGLAKSIEIDCAKVPIEEAELLQSLVDEVEFFNLPDPVFQPMPDEEQYSVTVETMRGSRHIYMNRSGIPAGLRPLINYLAKRAMYEKRK